MNNIKWTHILIVIFIAFLIVGCRTPDMRVRSYIENRPRVDQQIDGNAGYLYGEPKPEDLEPGKPTRKMFVVEVTRPSDDQAEGKYVIIEDAPTNPAVFKEPNRPKKQVPLREKINLPSFEDEKEEMVEPVKKQIPLENFIEYTVEKNDTLQKISKKFYDSYSKWTKIYEVNKDAIDNPDSIKPGTILRIPMEK